MAEQLSPQVKKAIAVLAAEIAEDKPEVSDLVKKLEDYTMACRSQVPTDNAPAAPAGLIAAADATGIVLSWDSNTEPDLASYKVYRATVEGGPYGAATVRTTPDYTDTTAVAGTTYWYRVTAVDLAGNESPYSVVSSTRPAADTTPPAAPTNVTTAQSGIDDVLIDWDPNSETDLAGYEVYRATSSGGVFGKISGGSLLTSSDFTDTSGSTGTTYYYKVKAVDTSGNASTFSAEVSFAIPAVDTTPPATPTGLVLVPSTAGIQLTWSAVSDTDLDHYEVESSPTGVGSWSSLGTPATASYNDTAASIGVATFYRVSAVDTSSNRSGYLAGSATRPSGSTPAESLIPSYVGSMVPCVVHARLVNKTNYNGTTGLTSVQSSDFPSFASQDPLLTQYEFNFAAGAGEPQGNYPQLRGFNAAHLYTQPGTYTIRGTVTPPDRGTPTVYETTRTFSADTRTPVYIIPGGQGSGSGSTPSTAVSPARAQAIQDASSGNLKLMFRKGSNFNNTSSSTPLLRITKDNCWVTSFDGGTGSSKPRIIFAATGNNFRKNIHVDNGADNTVISDLEFDQTYSGTPLNEADISIDDGATNTCVWNCTFKKGDRCIECNDQGSYGVLVLTCDAPNDNDRRDNFMGIGIGSDHVLLGIFKGNTLNEHAYRCSNLDRLLLHDCHFREMIVNSTDDAGSSCNLQNGNFYYIRKCYLEHIDVGELHCGPLDQCSGQGTGRTQYLIYEQCRIKAAVRVTHGAYHYMFRNNIFEWDSRIIWVKGYIYNHPTCSPTLKYDKGSRDINFYNNTFYLTGGGSSPIFNLDSMDAEQGETGPVVTGPVRIKNNLVVTGSAVGSGCQNVDFIDETVQGLVADRNIWSSAIRFKRESSTIDLSAWNALSGVGTDDAENVAFADANFTPGVGSKARTYARPVQGVWEDYNGTARNQSDANWSAGAIEV